ncbi:nitrate ABC transporter ATP-binding protein [Spirochaetia bacterium]|nr:nitrate ABC transporter ATP-binding protein [Spirochaetia bacterium]GHU29977.1 nitrate ABC transporter ATP-binding protein [Spirochaetia bacterium]
MSFFSCENISKSFGGKKIIDGIDLHVPEGGCISLVGPSGVGKTTLFNILAGLEPPDSGIVSLAGAEITGIPGRVSYMLQKDLLFEYRTVIDNVILPLLIRGEKKATARATVKPFFADFGLSGYEYHYPRQLSGGMRQRAALIRTIMMYNPVFLLDEPFSALDAITRLSMQQWYRNIAARMNLSTIFITHDVDEALALSDRVYLLTGHPGRITATIPVPSSGADFSLSHDYAILKRRILDAIL